MYLGESVSEMEDMIVQCLLENDLDGLSLGIAIKCYAEEGFT